MVDAPKSEEKNCGRAVHSRHDDQCQGAARGLVWPVRHLGSAHRGLETSTTEQPRALGHSVTRKEFGVLIQAKGHEIIAATWPVDPFGEQSDATTARIKAAAGSAVTRANET